jgi:hypothetical protein
MRHERRYAASRIMPSFTAVRAWGKENGAGSPAGISNRYNFYGHSSIQTTEKYLGGEQDIVNRGERSDLCAA